MALRTDSHDKFVVKYSYLILAIGFLFFHSCKMKPVSHDLDCTNSRDIASAPACRGLFEEASKEAPDTLFENIKDIDYKNEVFPNGKTYRKYTFSDLQQKALSPEYKKFLEETAEVISQPGSSFGHIVLRVGTKVYSFDNIRSTILSNFRFKRMNKVQGFASGQGFTLRWAKVKLALNVKN